MVTSDDLNINVWAIVVQRSKMRVHRATSVSEESDMNDSKDSTSEDGLKFDAGHSL